MNVILARILIVIIIEFIGSFMVAGDDISDSNGFKEAVSSLKRGFVIFNFFIMTFAIGFSIVALIIYVFVIALGG